MNLGLPFILLAALSASALAAPARTYRCGTGAGAYYSDKPCGVTPEARIGTVGPAPTAPTRYTPPMPSAPKAQEHVKYLSPDCASISEAIRTGPARGVRSDVLSSLHEEYRQKCAMEDADARARQQQDRIDEQRTQQAQRQNMRQQQSDKAQAENRCASMRDVIAVKRKREAELNEVEVRALRELEKSYNGQCLGR